MEYGGLKLTPKSWNVFTGTEKVSGRLEEDKVRPVKNQLPEDIPEHDRTLFRKIEEKEKRNC